MPEGYITALIKAGVVFGAGIIIYLLVYFLLFKKKGVWPSNVIFFLALLLGLTSIRYFLFFGPQEIIFKPLDFIVFLIAGGVVIRILDFYLVETKIETGEITFPLSWHKLILRLGYCLLGFIGALIMWDADFLPWFVLFGIITIIITIAFQDWLKYAIDGLQWGKIFKVGNWVAVGDKEGKIVEVSWQGLKLQTEDFNYLFIPSVVLSKEKVMDYGLSTQKHNCVIEIDVNYSVPPDKVKEILILGTSKIQGVIKFPLPQVFVISFDNIWIKYKIIFWIDNFSERRKIISKIHNLIWVHFKREEIQIPSPVYTIYSHAVSPEEEAKKKTEEILHKKEVLKKIDFLSLFPEEDLAEITEKSKKRLFLEKEKLIQQGQKGDVLFVILSGGIILSSKKKSLNKEPVVTSVGPGQFFGEMSVFLDEESLFTATVEKRSECLLIEKESIQKILVKNPSVVLSLGEILANIQTHQKGRIEEELDKAEDMMVVTVQQRIKNIASKIKEVFGITV
ncbi:mechanosensitive ion channel [bacterium]|nr:mechanosensitive ion channel [bacterium]